MNLTPQELQHFLGQLIGHDLKTATMIWGAPGLGKSSVVAQVAAQYDLAMTDLRLSQLAPTDLRGLPVADGGVSRWYPPEFLPTEGRGILFLDEINMAPPTMQGMAQQLILDRRVGSYQLPEGWFVWAAGNRKEDRASVFDMPAPLANRFLHLEVRADFEAWRSYAFSKNLSADIIAFLTFRPELLHRLSPNQPAWPSPRSWELAAQLYALGMNVAPAIGEAAAAELTAFVSLSASLPDLTGIFRGETPPFPEEPSARYAAVVGLAARAENTDEALNALRWLSKNAAPEWLQLYLATLIGRFQALGKLAELSHLMTADPELAGLIGQALALSQA